MRLFHRLKLDDWRRIARVAGLDPGLRVGVNPVPGRHERRCIELSMRFDDEPGKR